MLPPSLTTIYNNENQLQLFQIPVFLKLPSLFALKLGYFVLDRGERAAIICYKENFGGIERLNKFGFISMQDWKLA